MLSSVTVLPALNITLFILVMTRMAGFVMFNPLFGRGNVPVMLKAGLSFLLALAITPVLNIRVPVISGVIQLIFSIEWELIIGFLMGVLVNILISVVQLAGEQIDIQLGLTMANIYDPDSGTQTQLMGNFFNLIMVIIFFASNAHLSLLALAVDSFKTMPPGNFAISTQAFYSIAKLGKDYFELGFRMAMPIVIVEVICEVGIGILSKSVPQIDVFSVGMNAKSILGFILVLISIVTVASMCGTLSTYITDKTAELVSLMGAKGA